MGFVLAERNAAHDVVAAQQLERRGVAVTEHIALVLRDRALNGSGALVVVVTPKPLGGGAARGVVRGACVHAAIATISTPPRIEREYLDHSAAFWNSTYAVRGGSEIGVVIDWPEISSVYCPAGRPVAGFATSARLSATKI